MSYLEGGALAIGVFGSLLYLLPAGCRDPLNGTSALGSDVTAEPGPCKFHPGYPGDVNWTEEGHRFSWRMMLRAKEASVRFLVRDLETGEVRDFDHTDYLSYAQRDRVGRWPDMCLQFARFIRERLEAEGHENFAVHVHAEVSLNGSEPRYLIDPTVDLSKERRTLWPAPWILPAR